MDINEIADLFTPRIDNTLDPDPEPSRDASDPAPAFTAVRVSDIPARPILWVWPGWIPAGMLTILGGHVGEGKSTIVAAIAAALTTGATLPDGTIAPIANVLILSAEDDAARVIRPRLAANGADLDRVFILEHAAAPDATAGSPAPRPDLRRDASGLRAIVEDNDIRLIVIDPLGTFLRRSDRASEGHVREALQPLMDLIAGTGVAVLGVLRVGKGGPAAPPVQRLVGSSAIPAIARSVIMLAREEGSDNAPERGQGHGRGRAILEVVKGNYACPSYPVALQVFADGRVGWLGPAASSIQDVAHHAADPRLSRTERDDAADFLREFLAERPVNAITVLKQAKGLGISEITIRRAKKDLGITSFRDAQFRGFWMWRLPGSGPGPQPDRHPLSPKP